MSSGRRDRGLSLAGAAAAAAVIALLAILLYRAWPRPVEPVSGSGAAAASLALSKEEELRALAPDAAELRVRDGTASTSYEELLPAAAPAGSPLWVRDWTVEAFRIDPSGSWSAADGGSPYDVKRVTVRVSELRPAQQTGAGRKLFLPRRPRARLSFCIANIAPPRARG